MKLSRLLLLVLSYYDAQRSLTQREISAVQTVWNASVGKLAANIRPRLEQTEVIVRYW